MNGLLSPLEVKAIGFLLFHHDLSRNMRDRHSRYIGGIVLQTAFYVKLKVPESF